MKCSAKKKTETTAHTVIQNILYTTDSNEKKKTNTQQS